MTSWATNRFIRMTMLLGVTSCVDLHKKRGVALFRMVLIPSHILRWSSYFSPDYRHFLFYFQFTLVAQHNWIFLYSCLDGKVSTAWEFNVYKHHFVCSVYEVRNGPSVIFLFYFIFIYLFIYLFLESLQEGCVSNVGRCQEGFEKQYSDFKCTVVLLVNIENVWAFSMNFASLLHYCSCFVSHWCQNLITFGKEH